MKPAAFEYLRPSTVDETLALLAEHGESARILAGGQSLVPLLNFRVARFDTLIDINRLTELASISVADGELRLGAMCRYRQIETSPIVKQAAPLLYEATRAVAHLPIRNRGTIGGSLAQADIASEYPAVLLALDGRVIVGSTTGMRGVDAADFMLGPLTTALEPHEMIVEVRLPAAGPEDVFGFDEYSRRPGDLAIVGIAARASVSHGVVADSRVVAFGIGDGAFRIAASEAVLDGHAPHPAAIASAAKAAAAIEAQNDVHASGKLRSHLAGVLTGRVLSRMFGEFLA